MDPVKDVFRSLFAPITGIWRESPARVGSAASDRNEPTGEIPRLLRVRAFFACLVLMVIIAGLLVRLYILQVSEHEQHRAHADRYTKFRIDVTRPRASIRSRSGAPAAASFYCTKNPAALVVDWWTLQSVDIFPRGTYAFRTFFELCAVIGCTPDETAALLEKVLEKERLLATQGRRLYNFRIDPGLSPEAAYSVKKYCSHYEKERGAIWKRCVKLEEYRNRFYTFREEGAAGWKYCDLLKGPIGTVDLRGNGITGMESAFEPILKGRAGSHEQLKGERFFLRRAYPDGVGISPIEPLDIYITIDTRLQKILLDALNEGLDECGGLRASGIIMEPHTGEILAFGQASRVPGYHRVFGMPSQYDPFLGCYEPGSVFKTLVAVKALYEGLVSVPGPVIWREGRRRYTRYGPVTDTHAHHNVTFASGLVQSSNIVFSMVAEKLGGRKMAELIKDFRLIEKSFVARRHWERNSDADLGEPEYPRSIKPYDVIRMGFGYAIQVTLLDMARAYCEIVNGGFVVEPHVLYGTASPEGTFQPAFQGQHRTLFFNKKRTRKVCAQTADLLRRVVQDSHGTGRLLWKRDATLLFGGKTGTAKRAVRGGYSDRFYTGSFIGYSPLRDPKYVIAVKVDIDRESSTKLYPNSRYGVYYGGSTAGPIVWKIINVLHQGAPVAFAGSE